MKKSEKRRVSLVEFLRSIKFSRRKESPSVVETPDQLASLKSQVKSDNQGGEDPKLVRSAN